MRNERSLLSIGVSGNSFHASCVWVSRCGQIVSDQQVSLQYYEYVVSYTAWIPNYENRALYEFFFVSAVILLCLCTD